MDFDWIWVLLETEEDASFIGDYKMAKGKGNNLESFINKGLSKHEAQNEMMGAGGGKGKKKMKKQMKRGIKDK